MHVGYIIAWTLDTLSIIELFDFSLLSNSKEIYYSIGSYCYLHFTTRTCNQIYSNLDTSPCDH